MFKSSSKPTDRAADGVNALAHGAEDAASRVADAVEVVGARVAKKASSAGDKATVIGSQLGDRVAKGAGQAGDKASAIGSQVGDKVAKGASQASEKASALGDRASNVEIKKPKTPSRLRSKSGPKLKISRRGAIGEAALKAQLAKTSRELSSESTDLREAVDSLNSLIKANQKAGKKTGAGNRTRLIGGIAIGAVVAYHFDKEHGKERRATTAYAIKSAVKRRRADFG